jgi:hypothetical protein
MNVEIGTVATQFRFLGIIVSNFRNCGFAVQRLAYTDGKGVEFNETTAKKCLGLYYLYSLTVLTFGHLRRQQIKRKGKVLRAASELSLIF